VEQSRLRFYRFFSGGFVLSIDAEKKSMKDRVYDRAIARSLFLKDKPPNFISSVGMKHASAFTLYLGLSSIP
jgi:hypothetical protein